MAARGNFFAVDRRAWAAVCGLGSMNAAVAYLVLARGTLGDMRTTAWSVKAIETHTGVPRHLAQTAIKRLLAAGIVRQTREGTRPLYLLVAPHEIPAPEFADVTGQEDALLRMVEDAGTSIWIPQVAKLDSEWPSTTPIELARSLVRKGHLMELKGQVFGLAMAAEPVAEEPDWIWLPSALIDGAAAETAPVELLRQSQNLLALRLLIDLYHAQSLPRHGGVHWRTVRLKFSREKVGSYGAHTVWGFSNGELEAWPHQPLLQPFVDRSNQDHPLLSFWSVLELLLRTGLVAYALHVIEDDTDEATVLFPLGGTVSSKEEQLVGDAAHLASLAMLTEWQDKLSGASFEHFVPLLPHQDKAVLVGLLRLRYQADTTANAEWGERRPRWAEQARQFLALAEKAEASQSFATSIRYQI